MLTKQVEWGGGREAFCQGTTTVVNLVISGKDKTYKCTGARCNETCNIDLYERQISNSNSNTNRQYGKSVLLGKTSGNSQLRSATSSQ